MEGTSFVSYMFIAIKNEIENNNIENLIELLKVINLGDLSEQDSNFILFDFMNVASQFERKECAEIILEYWKTEYVEDEHPTILIPEAKFFVNYGVSESVLRFILSCPTVSKSEILDSMVTYVDTDEISVGITRLLQVTEFKLLTLRNFYKRAVDNYRTFAKEALEVFLKEKEETIDKPRYIIGSVPLAAKDFEEKVIEPEKISGLLDRELVISMLVQASGVGLDVENIEVAKEELGNKWDSLTTEEKEILLEPVINDAQLVQLSEDIELSRLFGPVNNMVGLRLGEDHPCSKNGGCRMLICRHFTDYDEEDDIDTDWFTENCDYCLRKIPFKCFAVRRPVPNGGWDGCFCSFECRELFYADDPMMQANILQNQLNENSRDKVLTLGIYLQENDAIDKYMESKMSE